jgi:hypothetical protein
MKKEIVTLLRRLLACLLIVSLPAQAGLVSTQSVSAAGSRDRIAVILERADVQSRLEAFGVSSADVKARVAAMSDTEVAQLSGQIDSLPAGGDATGILGLIVLVFLVLLVTDLLGLTHIFPFTKSLR